MIIDDKYLIINGEDLWTLIENCGYAAGRKGLSDDELKSSKTVFEINCKTLSCKVRVIKDDN